MPADVSRNLATARRVADMDGFVQVERCRQLREIICVGVHVVARPGLAGAPVPTTVMRDATIAMRREIEHLVLEGVGTERPAMAEDDGLAGAPVLVVEGCAVF